MMEEAFVACDMCRYHTTAQKLVEAELDMLVSWIPLCIQCCLTCCCFLAEP